MQSLREFFTSSSGLVPARQGLALGWVISALTGITVLLGAKEAGACPKDKTTCGYSADCEDYNSNTPYRECTSYWDSLCRKTHTDCDCVAFCP